MVANPKINALAIAALFALTSVHQACGMKYGQVVLSELKKYKLKTLVSFANDKFAQKMVEIENLEKEINHYNTMPALQFKDYSDTALLINQLIENCDVLKAQHEENKNSLKKEFQEELYSFGFSYHEKQRAVIERIIEMELYENVHLILPFFLSDRNWKKDGDF